jgi:hypothetical protein
MFAIPKLCLQVFKRMIAGRYSYWHFDDGLPKISHRASRDAEFISKRCCKFGLLSKEFVAELLYLQQLAFFGSHFRSPISLSVCMTGGQTEIRGSRKERSIFLAAPGIQDRKGEFQSFRKNRIGGRRSFVNFSPLRRTAMVMALFC